MKTWALPNEYNSVVDTVRTAQDSTDASELFDFEQEQLSCDKTKLDFMTVAKQVINTVYHRKQRSILSANITYVAMISNY
jgi:hypothetical protein